MTNLMTVLLSILSMFRVETALAISSNELITVDGNVWAVYDKLEANRTYTVIFCDNDTENIYDDIIISVN